MATTTKGYVGTGYDGFNYLNDFYEFDPVLNAWTQKANFPGSPRYEAVAFGLGSFGYVGTGFDGSNALKDFYQYDPSSDTWNSDMDSVEIKDMVQLLSLIIIRLMW